MSDYLCEELIVEIFTRLPPKSLLRFRSLSKYCYSSISSLNFIRMYTFRSPQKLLIRQKDNDVEEFYTLHSEDELSSCHRHRYSGITPVKFPYSINSRIVGSCNGILCLLDNENNISLWNPSIRRPQKCLFGVQMIGFGFDPITNDFKIVTVSNPRSRSPYVYAMKIGAWCEIASPRTLLFYKVISELTCCVNGALHWLLESHYNESGGLHSRYIRTFNLSTHVFGMISLPQPSWKIIGLTTVQGSLAAIAMDYYAGLIWVEEDDSWSVVFKWKINHMEGRLKGVLQMTDNGDLLFDTYYESFQPYNPKIGVPRLTPVCFNGASCQHNIFPCVESLQLLDVGTTF